MKNITFLVFTTMGIFSLLFGSLTQARSHHHHRKSEEKELDMVEQNAKQFEDMPDLLKELSDDLNDSAMRENHESRIEKRHISENGDTSARCVVESKYTFIDLYADATIKHSDKQDRALMNEMIKTARQWHWNSFEEFKNYADKVFEEVKSRHENDVK